MEDKTVGFIGLGSMGYPIARNLIEAGYQLNIYNRTSNKGLPLVKEGAVLTEKPKDILKPNGLFITMLANDQAVESVVFDSEQGLAPYLSPGHIHVSMSTISPTLSARLQSFHKEKGGVYLAAPVFGRPDAAAAKKLWVALAGPQEGKPRAQAVLKFTSQSIFDFGEEAAAANVVKIAGNFLILSAIEAMAEASSLASKCGLDQAKVLQMFSQSFLSCPAYQNYSRIICEERYNPPGFKLKLGLKDLNFVLDTALQTATPMPFASFLQQRLLSAIAKGRGDLDWTALAIQVREEAGL